MLFPRNANLVASARFFEKREGFIVTAAIEVMCEMRIDGRGEAILERRYLFGGGTQFLQMQSRVAREEFAIGDDGEALAKRGGEFIEDGRFDHGVQRCLTGGMLSTGIPRPRQ